MKRIDRKLDEIAFEYRLFVIAHNPKDESYCERADALAREWRLWYNLKDAIRNPRGQR